MRAKNDSHGYILADLLVGLLLTAFLAQATMTILSTHTRAHVQQDITADLEQNVRVGMRVLSDTLRGTGYGAPSTDLPRWIPWVSGFDGNPTMASGPPATISVARCTPLAVASLTAAAARGTTTLAIQSEVPGEPVSTLLDSSNKRLILVGGTELAHITRLSDGVVTIDTNVRKSGDQGLADSYPAETPICRIDVLTFSVDSATATLQLDQNQGDGPQTLADNISNLTITTVEAGVRYEIEMTALAQDTDPITGTQLTRTLRSDITLRNAL